GEVRHAGRRWELWDARRRALGLVDRERRAVGGGADRGAGRRARVGGDGGVTGERMGAEGCPYGKEHSERYSELSHWSSFLAAEAMVRSVQPTCPCLNRYISRVARTVHAELSPLGGSVHQLSVSP